METEQLEGNNSFELRQNWNVWMDFSNLFMHVVAKALAMLNCFCFYGKMDHKRFYHMIGPHLDYHP